MKKTNHDACDVLTYFTLKFYTQGLNPKPVNK